MGRHYKFRPGSFYRADDRTGFPTRAERTEKEWNGLIVDRNRWEARQPQDLVRGVKDNQSVPQPRPLAPDVFVGPYVTTTTATYGPASTVLAVDSVGPIAIGDKLRIMLDVGVNFATTVSAVGAGTVTIAPGLPSQASSGANVTDIDPGGVYGAPILGAPTHN